MVRYNQGGHEILFQNLMRNHRYNDDWDDWGNEEPTNPISRFLIWVFCGILSYRKTVIAGTGLFVLACYIILFIKIRENGERRAAMEKTFEYGVNAVVYMKPDSTSGIVRRRKHFNATNQYYVRYMSTRGYKNIYLFESEIY